MSMPDAESGMPDTGKTYTFKGLAATVLYASDM